MDRTMIVPASLALLLAGCTAGAGELGSGAAYVSPPFGEYTTPYGPTDLAPDARVGRNTDPFLRPPSLPTRR
jgi:hypothetical protein